MTYAEIQDGELYGCYGGDYDYYVKRGDALFGLYSGGDVEHPVEIPEPDDSAFYSLYR